MNNKPHDDDDEDDDANDDNDDDADDDEDHKLCCRLPIMAALSFLPLATAVIFARAENMISLFSFKIQHFFQLAKMGCFNV